MPIDSTNWAAAPSRPESPATASCRRARAARRGSLALAMALTLAWHLLLWVVFHAVFTPLGLGLRAIGVRGAAAGRDDRLPTYWRDRRRPRGRP